MTGNHGIFLTLTGRRTIRLIVTVLTLLNFLGANVAFAAVPQIVPDGRTQTTLKTAGRTTDVTTTTMLGQNAFNSFSRFNVDRYNTVNLHVPSNATNLLNFVHAEPSYINGVLNSVYNGKIGGNVFFLNPHGFMVGSGAAITVGSLTVMTPTAAFMDTLFDAGGTPSAAR